MIQKTFQEKNATSIIIAHVKTGHINRSYAVVEHHTIRLPSNNATLFSMGEINMIRRILLGAQAVRRWLIT